MLRADDRIGPYTLIRQLGQGGFGIVWLAEKRSAITTTEFALKLSFEGISNLDAVKKEAGLWKQAGGHPNILPIIEADLYDGYVVIVSEYASDGSLEGWLDRHQGVSPSVEKAVEITSGILAGLTHLHSRRIIHRDIKPANILLQGTTPRLADFGIARILQTNNLTQTLAGTPPYMAPEAFNGIRSVQTDIWSVGVVLYQLVSGQLPFVGQELVDLIKAITSIDPLPLPSSICPKLKKIISCALDKNTGLRYKSAEEMRVDLHNLSVSHLPEESDFTTVISPLDEPYTGSPQPSLTKFSVAAEQCISSQFVTQKDTVDSTMPNLERIEELARNSNKLPNIPLSNRRRWLYLIFITCVMIALIGAALSTYFHFVRTRYEVGTITGAANVNLRAEPSFSASLLEVLPEGTRVQILEAGGNWSRIKVLERPSNSSSLNAPTDGWIYSAYIRPD